MNQEVNWLERIQETASFIKQKVGGEMPKAAIILGSGLGNLVNEIDIKVAIPYSEIPNFPISTVEGHKGQLIFGNLGDKYVMAMQGRFHYYEGYSMKEATFPVRVMKAIGVKVLCVSNAAGGMNPNFRVGDVMLITDHINLFPDHPLRGKNYNELGPRFPAMNEAYSHRILDLARNIAKENDIRLMEGVYVGTQGPTFETPSEYRYFYRIGGDAVGMSTVPEVIVARHGDMEVFGLSVITDLGGEGIFVDVSHEEVQQAASKAEPIMSFLVKEIINKLEEV
ncbi:MAG: purine-nucleoside phosphorylase [Muribaculaceae bacterium]|nr:purine-nucleoside phosphorylase [Muribaculaceae bacterium]MBQ2563471.1 purine-nucleoside phosphorylase [Muribaculaceae bacterium]MBQ5408499.1 purine-nucleoside phosphorylase [Muribaculaceae bacterium]MDY6292791.1 purine-nucleoside phosphorylase [Bacteroidales bacterium]MDY6413355.1 purine-nucleoside phosphorylase [Bacteroidales bacterium]